MAKIVYSQTYGQNIRLTITPDPFSTSKKTSGTSRQKTTWNKGEGFKVDVDFSEIKSALTNIRSYDVRTQAAIESAVDNAIKNIKNSAQAKAPKNTGKLSKSIKSRFNKEEVVGTVYTKRFTAHLMEDGVSESTIMPRNWKALGIPQHGGHKVYLKHANIPPRAARPFMKPAFDEERPALIAAIKRAVAKL